VRREKRTEIDEAARLHPNSWSSIEVRLLDISASGFRAECEARVLVGSGVTLEVPGVGGVTAHVTWRRGTRFGAKFYRPIDLSRCAWPEVAPEVVLSRMLVERAEARQAGAFGQELELRRKILQNLPMQKLGEPAPGKGRAAP
jgi:hypothetical protein